MTLKITSLQKQNGAVLIVSLVMLVLMTIISLSSMRVTTLEEKMAGNALNTNLAFQAAETALRAAETSILAQDDAPDIDSTNLWDYNSLDSDSTDATPWWFEKDAAWWATTAVQYEDSSNVLSLDIAPTSVSERRLVGNREGGLSITRSSQPSTIIHYQITGHGTGPDPVSRFMVQSVVTKGY